MQVAPSGYYAAKSRPPSRRTLSDAALGEIVEVTFFDREKGRGVYGVRKRTAQLRRDGVTGMNDRPGRAVLGHQVALEERAEGHELAGLGDPAQQGDVASDRGQTSRDPAREDLRGQVDQLAAIAPGAGGDDDVFYVLPQTEGIARCWWAEAPVRAESLNERDDVDRPAPD